MSAADALASQPLARRAAKTFATSRGQLWATASLVSALTWPVETLDPRALPEQWPVGLHLATAEGLRFGHDVVFTYGPVGFLAFPALVTSGTAIASFLYALVVHTALVAVVFATMRRSYAWPVALAGAVVSGALPLPLADVPVVLIFAGAAWLIFDNVIDTTMLVVSGATVSGVEFLLKLNDGLICLSIVTVTSWFVSRQRIRATLLVVVAAFATILGTWLATGQRLVDLPQFIWLATHIVVSYGQGMHFERPSDQLQVAVGLLVASAVLTISQGWRLDRQRAVGFGLIVLLFAYGFFKEGFVRDDWSHPPIFFSALLIGVIIVRWHGSILRLGALGVALVAAAQMGVRSGVFGLLLVAAVGTAVVHFRPRARLRTLLLGLVAFSIAVLVVVGFVNHIADSRTFWLAATMVALTVGWPNFKARGGAAAAVLASLLVFGLAPGDARFRDILPFPPTAAANVVGQAATLASPSRRRKKLALYRAAVREKYPLGPSVISSLRRYTVDVETDGATIAWAYGLRWQPEPLIESYSAYDQVLDNFAARSIAQHGPRWILHEWTALDGQSPAWQGPALVLGEVCNYRRDTFYRERGIFSVLARDAGRCGKPRLLRTATVHSGTWVRVPHAGRREMVYATMRISQTLSGRIRSILYKPVGKRIAVEPGNKVYRFITGTAADPHILRLPAVENLPTPPGLPIDRFQLRDLSGHVQVSFYVVPVLR